MSFREPAITINGFPLTEGQAMTVRVAIEVFANGLEPSEKIDMAYKDRVEELRRMILAPSGDNS